MGLILEQAKQLMLAKFAHVQLSKLYNFPCNVQVGNKERSSVNGRHPIKTKQSGQRSDICASKNSQSTKEHRLSVETKPITRKHRCGKNTSIEAFSAAPCSEKIRGMDFPRFEFFSDIKCGCIPPHSGNRASTKNTRTNIIRPAYRSNIT